MQSYRYILVALFVLFSLFACGEVLQTEEDCQSGSQFFDQESDLCIDCPALTIPTCPLSCGYITTSDERGCIVNECSCDACEDGSFFDRDTFTCTECANIQSPACAAGCPTTGSVVDEFGCIQDVCACEPQCPEFEALDCGDEGCCEAVLTTREDGCEIPSCACPETPPEGFYLDDDSMCRACEGVDPVPEACQEPSN